MWRPAAVAAEGLQASAPAPQIEGVQIIDYTGPYEVLGHAYVNGIDAGSEDAQKISVSLLRPGRLTRVRLLTSALRLPTRSVHRPEVTGNVTASEKVDIRDNGSVDGDIISPRVAIAEGAHFRGSVDMQRKPGQPAQQGQPPRPQGQTQPQNQQNQQQPQSQPQNQPVVAR